ncbi:MAG TPA: efflux RND transporter periplasmic adaptor subunit [Terriglobales bacterium]|nr:efflux RND transporter periplasmic adaptor subunit [Terriglobales bacterium]
MKRFIVIGTTVVIGAVVVLALLFHKKPAVAPANAEREAQSDVVQLSPEAQRNTQIDVVLVAERTLSVNTETTGIITPDEARVAHVTPLSRGVVQTIYVKLGDRVAAHQPLMEYDNIEVGELGSEYRRLSAQVNKEKAQLAVAARSLDRAKALIKVEAISQRELDLRQSEYEQAEAAVTSAQADLAAAQQKLQRYGISGSALQPATATTVLRAPFAGIITKFSVAPGVQISPEGELFTIVDTSSVWAVANVFEKDVAGIATHGACTVSVASYPATFHGTITDVSDYLDPNSRTAKARCVVPNRDGRLKLDMYATVSLPAARSRSTLAIPTSAVQELEGKHIAFVQRDSTHFEKREVEVGETAGNWIEVKDGLQAGDKVVSRGVFYLKSALEKEKLSGDED